MSRILRDVGGVPVGLPIDGFFPSFASPGAGGTRLGPLGACGAVVVGVEEPAPPPAGMALVWVLPPQPDATRGAVVKTVAPAREMNGGRFTSAQGTRGARKLDDRPGSRRRRRRVGPGRGRLGWTRVGPRGG